MPQIHQDFTSPGPRTQWFVRGTTPDGIRWESRIRHNSKEAAETERLSYRPEMGDTKVMRETKFASQP